MTHTHAKGHVQRLVGSRDRLETDGWTDGRTGVGQSIALPPC